MLFDVHVDVLADVYQLVYFGVLVDMDCNMVVDADGFVDVYMFVDFAVLVDVD